MCLSMPQKFVGLLLKSVRSICIPPQSTIPVLDSWSIQLLQLIHPKACCCFVVVHKWEVCHPDAELVSPLQCDHILLCGRAHLRIQLRICAVAQVAVGLHYRLPIFPIFFHALPQLDPAGQRLKRVAPWEGHSGVDEVVAGLPDCQPAVSEIVDVL